MKMVQFRPDIWTGFAGRSRLLVTADGGVGEELHFLVPVGDHLLPVGRTGRSGRRLEGQVLTDEEAICSPKQRQVKANEIGLQARHVVEMDQWALDGLTHSPTLAAVVLEDALVGPGLGDAFQFGVPQLAAHAEDDGGQRKSVNVTIGVKTNEEKHDRPEGRLVN